MIEFDWHIAGIPCIIRVLSHEPRRAAYVSGQPEECYPAEGAVEWEVLDRKGRRADWLEAKLTDRQRDEIDEVVFEQME